MKGPTSTVDRAAAGLGGDGSFLIALRDAASGRFRVWRLYPSTEEWKLLPGGPYEYPIALDSRNHSLWTVCDLRQKKLLVEVWATDRLSWSCEVDGRIRALASARSDSGLLVGGLFESGPGRASPVAHLSQDGKLGLVDSILLQSRLAKAEADWTGLVSRGDRVWVASAGLPAVEWLDAADLSSVGSVPISEIAPDLRLLAEMNSAQAEKPSDWAEMFDCPLRLFPHRRGTALAVRRAHRAGWMVLYLNDLGRLLARVEFPFHALPLIADETWTVVLQSDVAEPGMPSTFRLIPTDALINGTTRPTDFTVTTGRSARRAVTRSADLAMADLDSRDPLLFIDPRTCVGDSIRVVASRLASAAPPHGRYTLAVIGETNSASIDSLVVTVGRQVPLHDEVLLWSGPMPADTRSIDELVGVAIWTGRPAGSSPEGAPQR